ncbi:RIP metalloprotease RseP [Macrococcoides bohemicum]|uniref:RIP metalloprotease RseP n=1 Tax=Macrococcoides bohemicum TaxID=1903056 RepID=UPI0010598B47|nr:RIP metalloprotease RseP [Macrococcus bohemicus]QYA45834.1 RIP metalloprotease RseP [Macrococcus bohemicus]TDL37005.1 RIP metalloprotease RseP [Macrococcus bohemicus]
MGIIAFIIIFGLLVTVHEYGHLLFAKRAGIMCPEFAIGMGPKIFSYKKDETLYTIRLLPVGGYVMMAGSGMEQNPLTEGMTVNIKRNEAGEVTHILLDDQHQFQQIEQLEVTDSDFEDRLFIEGINQYTNEQVRYNVAHEAYFVREGDLIQIAPLERQFKNKKPWPKFLALFAGPLFNFILAFVLFLALAFMVGAPTTTISGVAKDSPAQEVGLKKGDTIKQLNDEKVTSFNQIRNYLDKNGGKSIKVIVERDGKERTFNLEPKLMQQKVSKGKSLDRYIIGFGPEFGGSLLDKLQYGVSMTIDGATKIFTLLGIMFASIFNGTFSFDMLNGPVGIYKNTEKVASMGLETLIGYTAMLSVNLGIMNLLPIPALDGGRILFVIYEAIFRKPVNKKAEMYIVAAGALFVFFVMIMVTWNDISRYFLK